METFWQVLLIVGCAAIVVGVIVSRVVAWKKGKPTCDCGCDCAHCAHCVNATKKEKTE